VASLSGAVSVVVRESRVLAEPDKVPAMTRWGDGTPGEDPDATGVLPAFTDNAATHVFPALRPDAARSVGYPVDPASATIESAAVRDAGYSGRSADATVEQPSARGATDYPGGTGYAGAPQPPPVDEADASIAKHGAVMALGSVTSRVTGFIRTAAIGAAIGAAAIGNDYSLSNTLPGMVYELLLGGVLASVVVPLLVRARTRDADRGEAYAQRLLSLAVVFLACATAVAVLCAPLFTAVLANERTALADRELITTLSYLLLPMIFFYGMAALFAAVLNTRGHFAMPTFAPILNNLIVIGMCAVFVLVPVLNKDDAAGLTGTQIALLGLGTTLGITVQAAGLWPALRRVGFRWRWRWDFRQLRLRELVRVSSWMLAYVVVSQVAVVVVFKLAQMAADRAEGAAGPAIYNNAFLIFMMAHGIIAVSVITALMPRMAAAAAEHRHDDLTHQLSLGTRLTAVVLIPATVAYVVLGRPLAVTLFQWGNYHHEDALATGWVIAVAGLGLVPFAISQLQLFAFYAMPDTRTPAVINLPVVALRIGVDLLLYVVLPATLVAAGLMAGNAISFVVAAFLGYLLLRRRVGRLGISQILATLGRLGLAGLIAAVPTAVVLIGTTVIWGDGKVASLIQLGVCATVLIGAYVGAALWLRVPEVKELGTMVRSRLGR
jgi:putative peptidoglycan lipid II flippase